jgi:intermediate peptidase
MYRRIVNILPTPHGAMFGRVAKRFNASAAPATAVAAAAPSAMSIASSGLLTVPSGIDVPTMRFLGAPALLKETVDGTIEVCEELMFHLGRATDPVLKHDIIDSVSNVLCLLLDPCEMVRQLHPEQAYKMAATEAFMKGHQWMWHANARRDLYDHVCDIARPENQIALGPERWRNVHNLKRDMENNGIHLPDRDRKKVVDLNVEAENLAAQFIAERDGKNPYGVLRNLLVCRHDLANKLGYDSFASKSLRGAILDTPEKVWHFLCAVGNKYRPDAEREVEKIRSRQGEVRLRAHLTDEDRARLSVTLQKQYSLDGIEEYFTVGNCIRGIQILCEEVFGIVLKQVPFEAEEIISPDFKKFLAFDKANGNAFMGVIVLDMLARSSKQCQAGHLVVQLGCRPHKQALDLVGLDLGQRQYPVVVLTCNAGTHQRATRKSDGSFDEETTLMMHSEVVTTFHEFGHALHTLCAQTHVQNLAGTRSSVDFVECFSQFCEQFVTDYNFVKRWALKRTTGEPVPEELIQRRNEVTNLFQHLEVMDQVMLASVDQALHGPQPFVVFFPHKNGAMGKRTLNHLTDYGRGIFSFANLLLEISNPISVVTPTERGVLRSLSFEHLTQYPAGYYGYLYSGVFARRMWHKFFADQPMNLEQGLRLRREVMQHGAACDARTVLSTFLKEDLDNVEAWV